MFLLGLGYETLFILFKSLCGVTCCNRNSNVLDTLGSINILAVFDELAVFVELEN